jgi:hypothetical protein
MSITMARHLFSMPSMDHVSLRRGLRVKVPTKWISFVDLPKGLLLYGWLVMDVGWATIAR